MREQPTDIEEYVEKQLGVVIEPIRRYLPDERESITHKFTIEPNKRLIPAGEEVPEDVDGYVNVGMYKDGDPGEMFITIGKAGDELHGAYDMAMIAISLGLQYGVPLSKFVEKYQGQQFIPAGTVNREDGRSITAKSIADYLAKWLGEKFLGNEMHNGIG